MFRLQTFSNGSWRIKARKGVPKEIFELPTVVLPTEAEHKNEDNNEMEDPNYVEVKCESTNNQQQVDSQTTTTKRSGFISSPIERGEIKEWDQLESLWRHILLKDFNIKRTRNECPVILTVPSRWTKEEHERIAQIFFENFNVPGLYLAEQALMTLYGCGSVNGIVVDIGHGTIDITPILDTTVQYHAIQTLPIAGQDIDQYFLKLLQNDTRMLQEYGDSIDIEFARAMKELIGDCSGFDDPNVDLNSRVTVEYSGKEFTIGPERFQVADPLFDPSKVDKEGVLPLSDAIILSINNCDADKRAMFWENIVLTGGSSLMKGLIERLRRELDTQLTITDNMGEYQMKEVKFLKIPEYFTNLKDRQDLAAFLGASIVAKIVFNDTKNFISKVDYNENGPTIVHTKSY